MKIEGYRSRRHRRRVGSRRRNGARAARAGGKVMILDRPQSEGAALAKELGANAAFVGRRRHQRRRGAAAVQQTVERFGAIHINVNCAGTGAAMKTTSKGGPMPLEIFAKVIEINLIGTFNVLRLAATQMAKNTPNDDGERGVIVNTASVAAFDGQIGQAAYSASKGGVVGMTLPIARDLASLGIRVCTIAPGTFDTPMLAMLPEPHAPGAGGADPLPVAPRQAAASSPRWRATSSRTPMLNGETIRLDGALRMPPK